MNKIAPQDMRQHLMLNQSRLSTAEEVHQEVEDTEMQPRSFRVMTRVKLDSLLQLVEALRKVENLMECHTTFGKGSCAKGKGKMHKGLGFQPERGKQRKFGGYCNWCWRIGHEEAQCWFEQEYMKSDDFETPRLDRASHVFLRSEVQECHDGFDGIAKFVDEGF